MYHTIADEEAQRLLSRIPSEPVVDQIATLFKALGDPTRVKIVDLLSLSELCVHDLAQLIDVSQPAMSHHLRILRMARIVRTRRVGTAVHYSLDDQHVADLLHVTHDHARHATESAQSKD